MTLEELINAKPVSIYCIINEEDKKIYITYTIETICSIMYNIKKLSDMSLPNREMLFDRDKLSIKIIETYKRRNRLYLKWRVHELCKEYKELGYTLYNAYKPLQWKLYIGVSKAIPDGTGVHYKAIVKLKTSANVVYDIREFSSLEEAQTFVSGNTICDIVGRMV